MQIFQLQQAQLEVTSASSDESSALGQFIDSIKASTAKVQDSVTNAAVPLQKGKSRSWLSASRLQENVKKVNPFGRSKSIPSHGSDHREGIDPDGHHSHSILSFTAITESLSASSEDISDALGRKFERLLNSALSPSDDDHDGSSPAAVHVLHSETGKVRAVVRSASTQSEQSSSKSSLWSDMLPAVFRTATNSSSDDTTASTGECAPATQSSESTTPRDPTVKEFLERIATEPSSESSSASNEWELGSKEILSLLDESDDDDDDAEHDTEEEDDSSCSAGSEDGSILTTESGIEVAFQQELRSLGGALLRVGGACSACKPPGGPAGVDDDQFSVTSRTFPGIPNQQTRGRSRSPRPYTPPGLEYEPPSLDDEDEINVDSMKPGAPTSQETKGVLQTMFGCTGSQFLP